MVDNRSNYVLWKKTLSMLLTVIEWDLTELLLYNFYTDEREAWSLQACIHWPKFFPSAKHTHRFDLRQYTYIYLRMNSNWRRIILKKYKFVIYVRVTPDVRWWNVFKGFFSQVIVCTKSTYTFLFIFFSLSFFLGMYTHLLLQTLKRDLKLSLARICSPTWPRVIQVGSKLYMEKMTNELLWIEVDGGKLYLSILDTFSIKIGSRNISPNVSGLWFVRYQDARFELFFLNSLDKVFGGWRAERFKWMEKLAQRIS